jgi:putative addiction module component (TIGR02574 family)
MDITATLKQINALSIQERIRLVQAILESIAVEQSHPDLSESQKQELDRRIDNYEANPDDVLTWEEVKNSIKSQK